MDKSIYKKRDGRIFQMFDAFAEKPIEFSKAKHNYKRKDFETLSVGQSITFMPMFGNENPVYSRLKRLK